MLYRIIRPFARIALSVYFKKIYLHNIENVPLDKPVLLACNHPTAFVEPCIMACWVAKPLNFLARGDFFANPFLASILKGVNIIPVFRLRDGGYQKLKENYKSFEACYKAFNEKKIIMIMAEGGTVHEKRLRPIKKGPARLALQSMDNNPDLDLMIVPVGVNYNKVESFRSIAMLDFGRPIPVRKYYSSYSDNPVKGIQEITEALKNSLKEKVVHIENSEYDQTVNTLLEINKNDFSFNNSLPLNYDNKLSESQKAISDQFNSFSTEKKDQLKIKTEKYRKALKEFNLKDQYLNGSRSIRTLPFLFYMIFFPFLLPAYILNWIPLQLASIIAKKIIPEDITFQVPVKIVLGIFIYLFYFLLVFIIALQFLSITFTNCLLILGTILLSGIAALFFYDQTQKTRALLRNAITTESKKSEVKRIRRELKEEFTKN